MRVLHVESGRHLYGGPRQVQYLLRGLALRGVENILACPPDAAIGSATAADAEVITLPMRGDADLGLALRLQRLIRARGPDLVHLHSRRGADLWGGIAARLAARPCVLSRRVDNPEPRWVVGLKYRLYDHVVAISEGIRQVLLDEGLAPERVSCVRSAIDAAPWMGACDREAFRATLGLAPDTPLIAMVAQLIPRKGHRHLLAALPALLARHPRAKVLVYGRGPLRAELEAAIAARGFAGTVRMMGFVDHLERVLGCVDVVAHPADMEGLGVSLLQAAAAAVPIVASRAGGMPEAVRDGENGLLVPPGDSAALAAALIRLLDEPALARRMGAAGRALVLREFSVESMCEGNLAVYRELLARRRRAA